MKRNIKKTSNIVKDSKRKLIGIKSSLNLEQLKNKIVPELELLEIHLRVEDFLFENFILERLEYAKSLNKNLKFTLHCPFYETDNEFSSLVDEKFEFFLRRYKTLVQKEKSIIGIIQHIESRYDEKNIETIAIKNLQLIRKEKMIDYFYFENTLSKITFPFENYLIFLDRNGIKQICFDFSHYVANYSEEEFYDTLKLITKKYKVYYHISDNKFKSKNSFPKNLFNGNIDFKKIKKYVNFGILETYSKNEIIGKEIKEDYYKLKELWNF
ncbi:MAG: hypothetical protein QXR30_01800 [Candidatus Woesearchaeota archaeon]